ncbi:MAG TPA: alpha/beta hydrolase, partial [Isosphaeraceae bacterium]|nr:alpha/beta hydrolase [Isosphaeraceae bacterium]
MPPPHLWDWLLTTGTSRRSELRRRKMGSLGQFERLEARGLMAAGLVPSVLEADWLSPQGVVDVSTAGTVTRDASSLQAAAQQHGGIASLRNVMYPTSDGGTQLLDVYEPEGPAPAGGWPAVIAIHGGGWYKLSKDDFGKVVAPLTKEGYAVFAVDYQLSLPGVASWPGNIDDIRSAVRWVRQNATLLGVDPAKIAALGESAGGHLATLAAYDPTGAPAGGGSASTSSQVSAQVQAVVDFYGPTKLTALLS